MSPHAGVTKGTLCLYFRKKEELFKPVVRQELAPAIESAEAMVADFAVPSLVLLEQLAELFPRIIGSRIGGGIHPRCAQP
jgi:AcrR family transcriptional regulator